MTNTDDEKWFDFLRLLSQKIREESVFHNPIEMLPAIEMVVRSNAPSIINNPYHECIGGSCSMIPLTAFMYRRRLNAVDIATMGVEAGVDAGVGASSMAIVVRPQMDTEFSLANERIHVCVPEYCEHLKRGHVRECTMGAACPHASTVRYPQQDIYEFRDLFYCNTSGILHPCGTRCIQRHSQLTMNKRHTCPLTSMDLGEILEHDVPNAQHGANGAYYLTDGGEMDVSPPDGSSYNRSLKTHMQREQERISNYAIARDTILDLLMSRDRQKAECINIAAGSRRMKTDLRKVTRYRKNSARGSGVSGGSSGKPAMMRALWTLMSTKPVTGYFRCFPIIQSMHATFRANFRDIAENVEPRREIIDNALQTRLDYYSNTIARIMNGDSDAGDDDGERDRRTHMAPRISPNGLCIPPIPPWVHAQYGTWPALDKMLKMIDLAAKATLQVYDNLEKFSHLYTHRDNMFPTFKMLYVHIIRQMIKGFAMPANVTASIHVADNEMAVDASGSPREGECLITVIPKIAIMRLLPQQNEMRDYATVKKYAPNMRSPVQVLDEMMRMYSAIVRNGGIYSVEVKVHELTDEIFRAKSDAN